MRASFHAKWRGVLCLLFFNKILLPSNITFSHRALFAKLGNISWIRNHVTRLDYRARAKILDGL